ncbi:MAG: Uncharacterized protein AUREO_062830 [Aureobasidium pullulans]|nr:MAG: Uncharacterized protein AUREO_062830 [Aureobasidium pullulans]
MAARYVPPHIRDRRSSDFTASTLTRTQEPLNFSTIVSVNSNEDPQLNCTYVNHNQTPRGRASGLSAHLEATPSRGTPTAPRAMLNMPIRHLDSSRGRSRDAGHGHARGNRPIRTISPFIRHTHMPIMGPMLSLQDMLSRTPLSHMGPMFPVGRVPPMAPRALYAPRPRHSSTSLPSASRHIGVHHRTSMISTPLHTTINSHASIRPDSGLVSLEEIAAHFGLAHDQINHTLNASADQPDNLIFIVIFKSAHKSWYRHGIVYAKTDLHLLPGYELPYATDDGDNTMEDYGDNSDSDMYSVSDLIDLRSRAVSAASLRVELSSNSSNPSTPSTSEQAEKQGAYRPSSPHPEVFPSIALFSQVLPLDRIHGFKFVGWHEISETEFFAPNTPEVVDMLQRRGNKVAWESGVDRYEWAKIKLVRDEATERERGPLRIARLD